MLSKTQLIGLYLRPRIQLLFSTRLKSTNGSVEAKMSVTNDGQTIVCWHPDRPFPYQHSKPIPESNDSIKEEESVLKIQHRIDGRNIHRGTGPDIEELQMLTFTPHFQWKGGAQRYRSVTGYKRVLPKPPHPRKGL